MRSTSDCIGDSDDRGSADRTEDSTVPRDRTEDSAYAWRDLILQGCDTRRDVSLLITSIHTIICSGITESVTRVQHYITGKRDSSRVLTLDLYKGKREQALGGVALESLCLTH